MTKSKFLLLICLLASINLFAQVHVGMGTGYDFQTKMPIGSLTIGGNIKNLVLDGVITPSISRTVAANNYFILNAGYQLGTFIPAIGFYNNYKSADDKSLNSNCVGYSLKKMIPIKNDSRAIYVDALYTKNGFQLTTGIHCTL